MGEERSKRKADADSAEVPEKRLTKRQKRKKLNEKNKWPQHPKIQNMDQRSKAYIRVSGLGSSTKAKETVDPNLDLMSTDVKFGRLLGGTDQRKRHAAVNKLKAYLKARCDINNDGGGLSELDLLKLWKGLWYTLYMADKVPVQDELSKRLAELLWCVAGTEEEDEYAGQAYLDMCEEAEKTMADDFGEDDVTMEEMENTLRKEVGGDDDDEESEGEEEQDSDEEQQKDSEEEGDDLESEEEEEEVDVTLIPHCRGAHLASIFIRTFFRTIKREWGNMDKYRVDKFYTLTRMYLREVFKYMATRHWNLGIIRLFNDALFEEVLSQTPNGLRYHLIDITLEELAKANAKAPMPLTEATFLDTLEPYFAMCQTGAGDDTLQTRVLEKIVEKFLDEYSIVSEKARAEEDDDDEEKLLFDNVHVGSVAQFIFELASDPETNDRYRKSLYEMHKQYMRRLKKVGVDVELHEGNAEGEEDIQDYEVEKEEDEVPNEEERKEMDEEEMYQLKAAERMKQMKKGKNDAQLVVEESEEVDSQKESSKKKKKKKKKKKEAASPSFEIYHQEETLTISISEQKKAKKEGRKKKQKRRRKSTSEKEVEEHENSYAKSKDSGEKHVKWNKSNRSKSYKASMKALVTSNPPKTSIKTPEKSILLNKGTTPKSSKRKSVTSKAGRKRAVNYF
jgi:ribosomal RNA-processing protein 1